MGLICPGRRTRDRTRIRTSRSARVRGGVTQRAGRGGPGRCHHENGARRIAAMPVALKIAELESRVNEEIAVSPWQEIAQDRIELFARATEDFQWIHLDRERAKQSPFGGTIAHG